MKWVKYRMTKEISKSAQAQVWLKQFDENDVPTAKKLLDSIILVNVATVFKELGELLDNFISDKMQHKIALYVSTEKTSDDYFIDDVDDDGNEVRRPINISSSEMGSEGEITHFCRDYARSKKNVSSHPTIEEMKEKKCKFIVLIDDFVGSGNRMNSFLNWIYSDKTIKSWHSYGFVKFVIISFAMTVVGANQLKKHPAIDYMLYSRQLDFGRKSWNETERKNIVALCEKYSFYLKMRDKMTPLGYEGTFSMLIFSYKCPNTVPPILWLGNKRKWKRLFNPRAEFKMDADFSDAMDPINILKQIGHSRMAESLLVGRLNDEGKTIVLVLSLLASKNRKIDDLSEILNLSVCDINKILEQCFNNKWINNSLYLTESGKNLLKNIKSCKILATRELYLKNDFYFPCKLRGPTK